MSVIHYALEVAVAIAGAWCLAGCIAALVSRLMGDPIDFMDFVDIRRWQRR